MKANYVNIDHVHALITLPTNRTMEDIFHLLKGASSFWINKQVNYKFRWAKGYAAFSLSESDLDSIIRYINNQEAHHKSKSYSEEYEKLMGRFESIQRIKSI